MNNCERCDCRVSHLNPGLEKNSDGSDVMICDICYGSGVGNVLRWPAQYSDDVLVISKIIAQVGNMILEKMNERI